MNLVEKARIFATKAHEGQTRKVTGDPYIVHPTRVAKTLKDAGFRDEVIAAGFLHDVLEDTDVTYEELLAEFGEDVASLVVSNTENKALTWLERKTNTIEKAKKATLEQKALLCADKFDNLNQLIADYEKFGEGLWDFFKEGREKQKWYFQSVARSVMEGLEIDIPYYFVDYSRKVDIFFLIEDYKNKTQGS